MTYTIEELDEAIENEETSWNGDWNEFEELLDETTEWVKVPEGTEGARSFDHGKTFEKSLPKAVIGADLPGIGRAIGIDQFGGEGLGDDYWIVFKVTSDDGERIFKRNGYHASFDGSYLDGPTTEVKSVEKVVTVWQDVE